MAKNKLEDIIASINQNASIDETAKILDDLEQEKYGKYFKTRGKISTPADLIKLGEVRLDEAARNYLSNNPNRSIIPGASSQVEEGFGVKPFTPREIENTQFTLGPASESKNARLDALRKFAEQKARNAIESNRFKMEDSPASSNVNLKDVKKNFQAQKARNAIESNRFEMREGPTIKPEGLTKEETIAAFKKARADKISAIENQKTFSDIALIQKSWDRMAKKLGRNPTFFEVFDDMGGRASDMSSKALGKLGAIASSKPAQILTRGVIAPIAAYQEGKSALESAKKGEYTDSLSSGLGAASAVAGMVGSSTALPLAAGSLGIAGGKELGKKQAELADEGIFYDPTEGYGRSEDELSEDVQDKSPGKEDLFDISPVFGKNQWKTQERKQKEFKPVDYKKNAISEDELENLSNPEMVEKEKRQKIINNAIEMSKMNNKNYSDVEHQMVGMQALENYDKGKTLTKNLGDFFSNLFKKDPEDIKKEKAEKREKYIALNQKRIAAGLAPIDIPAGLEEEKPYIATEEDSKPYEFKNKQLGATPARSSGLKEGEQNFQDFLTKAQVKYPEAKNKDYVKDLSDEELQDVARKEARSKDLNLEKFDYEKNKAVIDAYNEVAQEEGMNPNLLLAHSRQESGLVPGIKNAEGTSTATGLGQLTVGAYEDVQKANPEFKDISFQELNDPKNIKLQAKAHAKYLKQLIANNGGDEEIALRKYFQGGRSNDYYQKLADKGVDSEGNRLTDEQKQKLRLRGWDGPEADNYVDRVEGFRNMLSDEPISVASRGPASESKASLNPKEEAMKRIRNFLRTGDKSVLGEENAPLSYGPSANPFAFEQGMTSSKRLLDLKKQYDEAMMQKGKTPSGESINFVPVEGEDGKMPEGMTAPSATPSNAPAAPQEEKNIELKLAEDAAKAQEGKQNELQNLIQQQSNLKADLLMAQNAAAENKFYANLARAATQIATGAAGLKSKVSAKMPDTGVFEDLQKQADQPITQLEQRIKIEGEDPNSEVSKSMRSILEQDLKDIGMENVNLSGLSYNQMKEIYSPVSSRISKLEAAKEKKEYKEKEQKKEDEAKQKTEGSKFLNMEATRLAKSDVKKEFAATESAMNVIDDYLNDSKNAVKSKGLSYIFPKIMDPQTGVKDYELRMLGLSGSALDRAKSIIMDFFKGTVTRKKALELKSLIEGKHKANAERFKKDLSSSIERGKRYNLGTNETALGILGADDYDELYVSPKVKEFADKYFEGDQDFARKTLIDRGDI